MIELRVLGGVDLRGRDGGEVDAILHKPKRLALLAYLAVAGSRTFRRDTLFGLFWPELDVEHARNALSQAVHVLRRSLGPGVLVNRDPGELGLDPSRVWCDARAFEQALAAGRLEEALELYRGDLLPGLFLSEALEFERWLEDERARFRERATEAAWRLSQAEEQAGHPGTAVHWARWAVGLSRDDEAALCRFVSMLDRVGDRAGALRAYDEYAARLAQEYESEPAAATRALIAAIRARGSAPPDAQSSDLTTGDGRAHGRVDARGAWPSPPRHAASSNLPLQSTPLIGRERELARLRRLLLREDVRLLTLTGPGGIGKTRLALGLAAELVEQFAGGIYLVELSAVADADRVVHAIARTVGVRETGSQPLAETIKQSLRDRAVLLVLDTFERVVEAAPLLDELLASCPLLKVLVTSRAMLHLKAEEVFPVPPLDLPHPERPLPLEVVSNCAALELFVTRARAVRPEFTLTESNAAAVTEICRRLEGMPLAIELAAARARGLAPEAILARLASPLELLSGRALGLSGRQQNLRRTIAWSYELLDRAEKTLFRRLAVFAGGCTIDGARAVCDPAGELASAVLEGLGSLVDKSLLRRGVARPGGEPRFGMLDTIREYALERLAGSGELDALRRRHAEYYLALARENDQELGGAMQVPSLERFSEEYDNLRAALSWSKESGELQIGLQLGGALGRFWRMRGYVSEGRGWLEALLQSRTSGGAPAPPAVRASALVWAGVLAENQGDYASALAHAGNALALCREIGDMPAMALALNTLGHVTHEQGDYERAAALHEESLELRRKLGDREGIAASLNNLGVVAQEQGDNHRAAALLEESLNIARELGNRYGITIVLSNLGDVAFGQHDYERATVLHEDSLELKRELGDKRGMAYSIYSRGDVAVEQADHELATRLYRKALELYREVGDKRGIAVCLEGMAKVACGCGDFARAGRLFGAAEGLRQRVGAPLSPAELIFYDSKVAVVRCELGDAEVAARWAEGWNFSPEQAIEFALQMSDSA